MRDLEIGVSFVHERRTRTRTHTRTVLHPCYRSICNPTPSLVRVVYPTDKKVNFRSTKKPIQSLRGPIRRGFLRFSVYCLDRGHLCYTMETVRVHSVFGRSGPT